MKKLTINGMQEANYATKEAFNSLRTNLQFCGDDIKVIALTSCVPNEGKSNTVMELTRSMTELGKKVLLIDADLRKSVLVGRYQMASEDAEDILGLTHYLTGQAKEEDVIYQTDIENLDILVAGHLTPNPTELLGSEKFKELLAKQRENYDMILIDSPPLGSVIDTAIIAPSVDGVILVIASDNISYHFAQDIKKQLEMTGCRILGVILNKVKMDKGGYYNYYGGKYYGKQYGHYYGDKETQQAEK